MPIVNRHYDDVVRDHAAALGQSSQQGNSEIERLKAEIADLKRQLNEKSGGSEPQRVTVVATPEGGYIEPTDK